MYNQYSQHEKPIVKGCTPILLDYKIGLIAILSFFSAIGLGFSIEGPGEHPTSWLDIFLLLIMSLSVISIPFTGIIRKIAYFVPGHNYILKEAGLLPYARWFFEIIFDWLFLGIGIVLFGITIYNIFTQKIIFNIA